jgi:dTDP-4-dehydrorhamnose 3,5-epimerase-like enzyme
MMTMPQVQIAELPNHGDQRGFSFTIPADALQFLGSIHDIHVASILPGAVRGNHFHQRRREVLLLAYAGAWSFHWDEGVGKSTQHRSFQGTGAALIRISPGASHAVRNDGEQPLTVMASSSEPYDPQDSIVRRVI